jgi:hypothetical protein
MSLWRSVPMTAMSMPTSPSMTPRRAVCGPERPRKQKMKRAAATT